jgi:hypothetical protein
MSNEITIIPYNEMRLPQKVRKRLPPLVSSTYASVCILFVVNFGSNVRASKV